MLNPDRNGKTPQIYVWEPFLRLFHWSLVVGEIRQRLNPPPLVDLNAKADELIGKLSGQPWAKQILKEMEPADAT